MSMYRQLWLAIVASMLLALLGGLLASMLSARSYLESQLSIKNTDNATALALSLSQSNPDPVTADLVLASLFDSGHYELVRIVDPTGKLISERIAPAGDLDAPGWFAAMLPIRAKPGQAQITNGWQQFGTATLISHSRYAYGALWKSAYQMALALSIAGLIGGYMGGLVLRRIRKPLNTVIEQADAISQRRFVTVEEPEVPELRQLAIAMNATVVRLKAMFDDEASRLEQVRQEANFDPLTGLANRNYFMGRVRQMVDSDDSTGGILLMVRLADLAGVNRRLGRAATDDYLKTMGKTIGAGTPQATPLVAARLNGADFALLLPPGDTCLDTAKSLMQTVLRAAAPFMDAGDTASIGVGRFVQGEDMGGLLSRVDMALATAEAAHGNAVQEATVTTTDDMPRTAEQWATMIRTALDQRWARLIGFPVVSGQGSLLHRECPLRLKFAADADWLPAGRFLPVAERLKLTASLDLTAVALGLEELDATPQLSGLAINLSASSLEDPSFHTQLVSTLQARPAAAARLWLELAEDGALKHLDAFRALCKALKTLRCHVGLEHFGHSFSQIGQLHDLGLDYLKVDSSFIRGIDSNAGNAAFLKGLCSIAHNIGLSVLAEGVAAQAEFDALIHIGFDGATGPAIKEAAAPPQ